MAAGGHFNYLETLKGDNRSPPLKTFLRPLSTRINSKKNLYNQLLVLRAGTLTMVSLQVLGSMRPVQYIR